MRSAQAWGTTAMPLPEQAAAIKKGRCFEVPVKETLRADLVDDVGPTWRIRHPETRKIYYVRREMVDVVADAAPAHPSRAQATTPAPVTPKPDVNRLYRAYQDLCDLLRETLRENAHSQTAEYYRDRAERAKKNKRETLAVLPPNIILTSAESRQVSEYQTTIAILDARTAAYQSQDVHSHERLMRQLNRSSFCGLLVVKAHFDSAIRQYGYPITPAAIPDDYCAVE